MATDVEDFINEHNLQDSILIGHSMGAKVAMTVALQSPELISALVPVDNAPIDAALKSDFGKYMQAMRKLEQSNITKQAEADAILAEFEPASKL
ncbi:hypothetical protein MMC25_003651 [Agyrium rufum]|nr:hypothetical protein [Agyrium rufum]